MHGYACFFAGNDNVLDVLLDREERAGFDVVIAAVFDQVFDCLAGRGIELHFVKDDGRFPLVQ